MVEVGAGEGMLTAELAARCRDLVAIEVDERLVRGLRERFSRVQHVRVLQADSLRFELPRGRPYKVVGNIPYHHTAAILRRLVDAPSPPEDAYLVVQTEAAERFAGVPFAKETLMSLRLKPWWQVEIVRRLRRTDFDPPPRVDSALLWLARRTRPLLRSSEASRYHRFIESCFGRDSRTLGHCLGHVFSRTQLRRLGRDLRFDPGSPPSSLSFDQWLGLFRFHLLDKRALRGGARKHP